MDNVCDPKFPSVLLYLRDRANLRFFKFWENFVKFDFFDIFKNVVLWLLTMQVIHNFYLFRSKLFTVSEISPFYLKIAKVFPKFRTHDLEVVSPKTMKRHPYIAVLLQSLKMLHSVVTEICTGQKSATPVAPIAGHNKAAGCGFNKSCRLWLKSLVSCMLKKFFFLPNQKIYPKRGQSAGPMEKFTSMSPLTFVCWQKWLVQLCKPIILLK